MKKLYLPTLIMGGAGGILLVIGLVLCLLPEWNLSIPGVIAGTIGLLILIALIPIHKSLAGKLSIKMNGKTALMIAIGIAGLFMLGTGMCLCMIDTTTPKMVIGMVIGMIGIVLIIINYPISKL